MANASFWGFGVNGVNVQQLVDQQFEKENECADEIDEIFVILLNLKQGNAKQPHALYQHCGKIGVNGDHVFRLVELVLSSDIEFAKKRMSVMKQEGQ